MPEIVTMKHNEPLSESVLAGDVVLVCRVAALRTPLVITDSQHNTYTVAVSRQETSYLEISSAVVQDSGSNTLSVTGDGDITVLVVRGIEQTDDGLLMTGQTQQNFCCWQCGSDGEWLVIGVGECPADWVPVAGAVRRLDSLGRGGG